MPTPQPYKNEDADELKFYNSSSELMDLLAGERSEFFDSAYTCYELGSVLWETKRAPLTNAITEEIFRKSFAEIFEAFIGAGTGNAYITVFQKIFGDDVEITFTVPAPGKLQIHILAATIEISNFVARIPNGSVYDYDQVITQDGVDNIVFQSIEGFATEYELTQMLFEMVPNGIYTTITLDLED